MAMAQVGTLGKHLGPGMCSAPSSVLKLVLSKPNFLFWPFPWYCLEYRSNWSPIWHRRYFFRGSNFRGFLVSCLGKQNLLFQMQCVRYLIDVLYLFIKCFRNFGADISICSQVSESPGKPMRKLCKKREIFSMLIAKIILDFRNHCLLIYQKKE